MGRPISVHRLLRISAIVILACSLVGAVASLRRYLSTNSRLSHERPSVSDLVSEDAKQHRGTRGLDSIAEGLDATASDLSLADMRKYADRLREFASTVEAPDQPELGFREYLLQLFTVLEYADRLSVSAGESDAGQEGRHLRDNCAELARDLISAGEGPVTPLLVGLLHYEGARFEAAERCLGHAGRVAQDARQGQEIDLLRLECVARCGDYDACIRGLRKVCKAAPSAEMRHRVLYLSSLCALLKGDRSEALSLLTETISACPTSAFGERAEKLKASLVKRPDPGRK